MFPNEMKETYFIPCVDREAAKGKLYQAYKSYRERLSAAGLITVRSKAKKRKVAAVEDAEDPLQLPHEDSISQIEFLTTHTDPWSKILNNWKNTWAERVILLKENSTEVYLQTFPCLRMANGFELVSNLFKIYSKRL